MGTSCFFDPIGFSDFYPIAYSFWIGLAIGVSFGKIWIGCSFIIVFSLGIAETIGFS